ncbi:MAG TPA: hypothetical protein VN669_08315 [Candidatus Acidoferrales bacterium]|jgi:uncharacterized membrane protein|nr:hypothetical protein [Candidatus Acidoferrales bacterium]
MHPPIIAMFLESSRTGVAMCTAGGVVLLIGAWAAKKDIAEARGLDKIVALKNVCFAAPLAVFGALHFFGPQFVKDLVPPYMPGRMFWVYFVGCALIAASLSIATRIAVRWSGLLVGIMMFSFVAMLYLPSGLRHLHARITWTIVFRETSFGGAGWILAGTAMNAWRAGRKSTLVSVGRVCVTLAVIVFGVLHFLYPTGLPGVPLQKQLALWIPGRVVIDYLTGAALLAAAGSVVLRSKGRTVTTCLGAWLLLMLLIIYLPVMITALLQPAIGTKVEGINYFFDTLLFTGAIFALASATPQPAVERSGTVTKTLSATGTESSAQR